jgi:hypothetical protein
MKTRWLKVALLTAFLSIGCNAHNGGSVATAPATVDEVWTALPAVDGSFKFVVLGDWGTGFRGQYDLAAQMARFHDKLKFETVITVGTSRTGCSARRIIKQNSKIPASPRRRRQGSTPPSAITTRASR